MEVVYVIMFFVGIGMLVCGLAFTDVVEENWQITLCIVIAIIGFCCAAFSIVKIVNIENIDDNKNEQVILELIHDNKISVEDAIDLLKWKS